MLACTWWHQYATDGFHMTPFYETFTFILTDESPREQRNQRLSKGSSDGNSV